MQGRSLLDRLSDEDRHAVTAIAVRRRYPENGTVFHVGDPGDTLHLIVKGRVAVRTVTPRGDVATLALLGPGDSFGELAVVLPDAARSASVVALEPLETLTLHRGEVDAMRRRSPAMDRFLVELLARQVLRLTDQIVEA